MHVEVVGVKLYVELPWEFRKHSCGKCNSVMKTSVINNYQEISIKLSQMFIVNFITFYVIIRKILYKVQSIKL